MREAFEAWKIKGYTKGMKNEFLSHSPESTSQFGAELAKNIKPGLITLSGELGAGKTKLTAGILKAFGAEGPYQSPTFMLVKEYHLPRITASGIARIYHCDAYRLAAKDFEALGFQALLEDSEGLIILEWPERVKELLPEKRIDITLTQRSETERRICIEEKS